MCNGNHLIFYLGSYFVAHVCLQRKVKHIKVFFLMQHLEESPRKISFPPKIATPPFLDQPPILPYPRFSSKNFQIPPFPSIPPSPLYVGVGGGCRTMDSIFPYVFLSYLHMKNFTSINSYHLRIHC